MSSPVEANGRYGVRSVTHAYGQVAVLVNAEFALDRGRIHGLVGENGAGKTTLVKILTGDVVPTEGEVYLDDRVIALESPVHARSLGVRAVHQHVALFPFMDVVTNIYGVTRRLPRRGMLRRIDWDLVTRDVQALLDRLGVRIPLKAPLEALSLGEQRMVEIIRAVMEEPRFLIMDEVTAALDPEASDHVLELLVRLRDEEGVGICFISHRLDEVRRISDQVTVLRNGRVVDVLDDHPPEEEMISRMLGREHPIEDVRQSMGLLGRDDAAPGDVPAVSLRVDSPYANAQISLSVQAGEVLGLTGALGSGAHEVVRMLGGAQRFEGTVEVHGAEVVIASPRTAIRAGIGFIPGDRQREAVVEDEDVAVNTFLPSFRRFVRRLLLRRKLLYSEALRSCRTLDIRASSVRAPLRTLSGGNQQKVVIARVLALRAGVLALEEPTHGVDVGAKTEIQLLIAAAASDGGAVVLASTDVNELLAICDRVAVFRHGRIVGVVPVGDPVREAGSDPSRELEGLRQLINRLMAGVSDRPENAINVR